MHRMKPKMTLLVATGVAGVAGLAFFGTGSALAGANGQKVALCQSQGKHTSAVVRGSNQDGQETRAEVKLTGECTTVEGFFWKGEVFIDWIGDPEFDITNSCSVPEVSDVDTHKCEAVQQG